MSIELMDTYVYIYIYILYLYIYIHKIKMAKYAWFFSIILVSVFFLKLVFTHVLRTKLSSLELRSLYHEL